MSPGNQGDIYVDICAIIHTGHIYRIDLIVLQCIVCHTVEISLAVRLLVTLLLCGNRHVWMK